MDLSIKRQSWFGHLYQTLCQEGDGTMKQDFDDIEKQVEAVGEKMKRLCSNFFHDLQPPEKNVMRSDPQLDSEGDASSSGNANLLRSIENEPEKSIPYESHVTCPLENYMGHELSEPDPFGFDPQLDPQRSIPVVESDDEHVQMSTEQLQVTCHVDPLQEPVEPQTCNCTSQNSNEVPVSSSDVGIPDQPTCFEIIKYQGHTLDDPNQRPEQNEPQSSNPYSQNLFQLPESSLDMVLADNLAVLNGMKNQLGHSFNDPSQEPTGSQTSDPSSPALFEAQESSSELELLDITFAFDIANNLPGHFFDDSSRGKSGCHTCNPFSKNSYEVPESSDKLLLDEPTAFGSVKNRQRHMFDSSGAPVSVHLLEGKWTKSSLGRTDGALTKEKAAMFWKENAMQGESSALEVHLISSLEKISSEADSLSVHFPGNDNANSASLAPNKLSPANSVHAEEDLIPSDNFKVETVCTTGSSTTITSCNMSSPVASHEEEAKTVDIESLSYKVEVESYESEILPEVSFQRGSFCDDEVGIVRSIPKSSSFTPFALSGGHVENASGFSDATSSTEVYRKEQIQFDESAEFHDLSFSSDKDEEVKLEESCVALDSHELYALSLRIQRLRSFKKKIMDTFSRRQRTVKEYEQLGIWYEDGEIKSKVNWETENTASPSAISAFSDCQSSQERQIDSDWELL